MKSAVLAAALLGAFAFAAAQDADPQAPLKAQLARIQQLREQRPGDGLLAYFQALTHVQLGQKAEALAQLRSLAGRKLGIIPTRDIGFDAVWDDAEFQAVVRELTDDEPRTPDSPVVLRLKDTQLVPEGIAYDAKRRTHFLSSVAQRKIVAVDAKGRQRDFSSPADKLDRVLGLAVDARNDRLCAVSTNGFEDGAQKERRNAVVCYSIALRKRLSRVDVPDARQLNDLSLGSDGSWYVSDSAAGSLYRIAPGASAAQRIGDVGSVRSANGVAPAAGNIVYVGISTGIARVDADTGQITRMAQPDTAVTGGIDGLYWDGAALYGVQNVTTPGRVIRIDLTEGGTKIAGVQVLQSHHHPEFDEPTTGVLADGALHVIANSYVAHFRPDGTLRDPQHLRGTAILAVPLRR
jgi:sugar lactone lactonase YvrE